MFSGHIERFPGLVLMELIKSGKSANLPRKRSKMSCKENMLGGKGNLSWGEGHLSGGPRNVNKSEGLSYRRI